MCWLGGMGTERPCTCVFGAWGKRHVLFLVPTSCEHACIHTQAEKRRRGISSSSSGASKPKSEKERLKEKAEARKLQAQQAASTSNNDAGAGEKKGVTEGPEDLARKVSD